MKVIVLGAGTIGVTTAYFLARDGHQVTVLEKNSASSLGCSYANGGQLSYSHIEPWSSKTSLISIAKSFFSSSSFLSISDFFDRDFLCWSWQFLKNSNSKKSQEISRKIFALNSYSKKALQDILATEENLKFDYQNNGILHFFRDQKSFNHAIKEAEFAKSLGCEMQILSKEECVKKEQTLTKICDEGNLVGGVFYSMDASGNSMLFTKALEKICREKYGVNFEYNSDIKNIFTNYQKITGINSNKGVFVADKYVYALGAGGNKLLKGIGINSKIFPLKGYSLSIAADEEFIAPKMALTDSKNKIVYSRIGDIFRVAGTVEVCASKNGADQKHINFLKEIVRTSFSDFGNMNENQEWCGFRPFRPNSIPLICQSKKYENFLLNAGHGSLGWTMSAASGRILSDLVSNKEQAQFAFLKEEEREIYINNKY